MEVFGQLGFTSDKVTVNFGRRPGMATSGHVATTPRLWADYTADEGTDKTLGLWLAKHWGISALRILPIDLAPKVIGTLHAMCARRQTTDKVA